MLRLFTRHRTGAYAKLLLATLIAAGCSNVLGIDDPTSKPPDGGAGEAGEGPTASGGAQPMAGSAGNTAGGNAGSGGNGGTLAGQSGMAGTLSGAGEGGEAGVAGGNGCGRAGELRCDPSSPTTPQICSSGEWTQNTAENGGDNCPVLCDAGKCVECKTGDTQCNGNFPETCVNGAWTTSTAECTGFCANGACVNPKSCAPTLKCGDTQTHNCCRALEVTGGSFDRDGDPGFPATISTFMLDEFEVTNERIKAFVEAYDGSADTKPAVGAGKSAHIADDPGWQASYPLPATSADLINQLKCVGSGTTPDPDATWGNVIRFLPANCVNFYVAYAFCIWDGGRLPTEAEWNYAATGGNEQRYYPWSDPPTSDAIDADHAVGGDGASGPKAVGLLPAGRGRYGQSDLAGNVAEWTLDYFADTYPTTQCDDCINATPGSPSARSVRGGGWTAGDVFFLQTAYRTPVNSDNARTFGGFRCAYDLPKAASN